MRLAGALLLVSAPCARAHAVLIEPSPRVPVVPNEVGIKLTPFSDAQRIGNEGCGGLANNDPGVVTPTDVFAPGDPVTVRWLNTLVHPGDVEPEIETGVRIAVHYAPGDSFNENTLAGGVGPGDYVRIQPHPPGATNNDLGQTLAFLPEKKTALYATIQFLWAAKNDNGFYLGCADIAITSDRTLPDFDNLPADQRQEGKPLASGRVVDADGNVIADDTGGGGGGGGGGTTAAVVIVLLLVAAVAGYCLYKRYSGGGSSKGPPPPPTLDGGDGALPPGWSSAVDPSSSRVYYVNGATGQTSWEKPTAVGAPPGAPPGLPPGWTSQIDPASGKSYYVNSATGQTSWEMPGRV